MKISITTLALLLLASCSTITVETEEETKGECIAAPDLGVVKV